MTTKDWTLNPQEGQDLVDALEIAYEQCTVIEPELADSILGMLRRFRFSKAVTVTEFVTETAKEEDPEILEFSTGRHYGPEGQRIIAQKVVWEKRHGVAFVDHTRGIEGFIPYCGFTETNIMYHYDLGHYFGIWGPEIEALKAHK